MSRVLVVPSENITDDGVSRVRDFHRDFGHKVVGIKPIVKQIQKLLEDRDKIVREETKLMVIEMYRWVGAALKPQLANLKPVQVRAHTLPRLH